MFDSCFHHCWCLLTNANWSYSGPLSISLACSCWCSHQSVPTLTSVGGSGAYCCPCQVHSTKARIWKVATAHNWRIQQIQWLPVSRTYLYMHIAMHTFLERNYKFSKPKWTFDYIWKIFKLWNSPPPTTSFSVRIQLCVEIMTVATAIF